MSGIGGMGSHSCGVSARKARRASPQGLAYRYRLKRAGRLAPLPATVRTWTPALNNPIWKALASALKHAGKRKEGRKVSEVVKNDLQRGRDQASARLLELRRAAGLSQAELSRLVGVQVTIISPLDTGRTQCASDQIASLAGSAEVRYEGSRPTAADLLRSRPFQ